MNMGLVEVEPIKINPWKRLGKAIGLAINGDVLNEITALKKDLSALDKKVDGMEANQAERDAKSTRMRIIRFDDELLNKKCTQRSIFGTFWVI